MADWSKGYPVVYTESGDTTAEAFLKHINELTDVYTHLNSLKNLKFTGLVEYEGGFVSLNTDIKKIDITACTYWLNGEPYSYAGGTAISPTITGSDTSIWVGLDSSGLLYSADTWTDIQKKTIIPLCRIQTVQGQSGSGSDLQSPIDQRWVEGEQGYHKRLKQEQTIGALYHKGGEITNSATAFQVSQNAGIFWTATDIQKTVSASSNLQASTLKHVSGSWSLGTRATIVTPKYYDNGTDEVALGNNDWATHTLLKSPKEDDAFILVMSPAKYASQAEAQSVGIYYGLFVNAYLSGLMPVAHLIVKGNGTDVIIEDRRPLIGENAGAIIGTATMQQIYENSAEPEILTDAIRGALSVKRGSTADTDNVLEILNGAGDTVFAVTGEGLITSPSILGNTNIVRNWNFDTNQRSYVSGTATTGANEYTLDGWRIITSGENLTFSKTAGKVTVTAPTNGVENLTEGALLQSGNYKVSWEGTATLTVDGTARTNGEVFAITGGANVSAKLFNGTVANFRIDSVFGNVDDKLQENQRYYLPITVGTYAQAIVGTGYCPASTYGVVKISTPSTMRTTPSLVGGFVLATDVFLFVNGSNLTPSSVGAITLLNNGVHVRFNVTGATGNHSCSVICTTTLALSAEL